jgi:VCBS repeat-containing protein
VDTGETAQLVVHNLLAVKSDGSSAGTVTDNADGTFTFHPAADYNGAVSFNYDVQDPQGASVTTSASMSLAAVADAAVITDGTPQRQEMTEDQRVSSNGILQTDQNRLHIVDPDSGEAVFVPTGAAQGTGTTATGTWVTGDKGIGEFILHADGRWFYKVDNDLSQIDSLGTGDKFTETLTVHSADGTAHVLSVTVNGTNDAPVVSASTQLTDGNEDTSMSLHASHLLANAMDADDGDTSQLSVHNLVADHGSVIDNHDGTFTFKPEANYNGHVRFSYEVQDPQGASTTAVATLNLAAARVVDHSPVIDPSLLTFQRLGSGLHGTLGATDPDIGEAHTWSVSTHKGGSSHTSMHGQYGTLSIDEHSGIWNFTPDGNGGGVNKTGSMPTSSGSQSDTFYVTNTDAAGHSHSMQFEVELQVDAHNVHGNSGHWVANITALDAHLDQSDEGVSDVDIFDAPTIEIGGVDLTPDDTINSDAAHQVNMDSLDTIEGENEDNSGSHAVSGNDYSDIFHSAGAELHDSYAAMTHETDANPMAETLVDHGAILEQGGGGEDGVLDPATMADFLDQQDQVLNPDSDANNDALLPDPLDESAADASLDDPSLYQRDDHHQ